MFSKLLMNYGLDNVFFFILCMKRLRAIKEYQIVKLDIQILYMYFLQVSQHPGNPAELDQHHTDPRSWPGHSQTFLWVALYEPRCKLSSLIDSTDMSLMRAIWLNYNDNYLWNIQLLYISSTLSRVVSDLSISVILLHITILLPHLHVPRPHFISVSPPSTGIIVISLLLTPTSTPHIYSTRFTLIF